MKKLLTTAMASVALLAAGLPTDALAQYRGGPQSGARGGYQSSYHRSSYGGHHGGYHGGHGDSHGWSTAGQILTGVFIGGLLADICSPRPACQQVVCAQPVYQQPVVQYVQTPGVVVQQVPALETFWVTNSNGSRTPIQLRRADGGMYVGPKGEYYVGQPTNEQLRQVYGF